MKRAVVPGTFDPITEGHKDVIRRASQFFDEVIVAVARSEKKQPLFSHDERIELARKSVAEFPRVRVEGFSGLLVDFVADCKADVVVKGLRAITDFEYEFQMTALNYELDESVETLFFMSSPQHMYLSSSVVREIASYQGDVSKFVSPCVQEALDQRFRS